MRLVAGILSLVLLSSALLFAQAASDEFTIVALPDTQFYSKSYPQIFASQTKWIADHIRDQNIQLVVGLGDIVDGGGEIAQWQNADAAVRQLDGKVPYMIALGNHDYDQNNPSGRTAATHNFNAYFGPQRYSGAPWYRASYPNASNENFYGIVNINGTEYLILVLEFDARDSALSWASTVLNNHPAAEVIIVTHSFTYYDNTRMSQCDVNSAATFGVAKDNNGEDMWWKLVRKFPNVRMVLSGHVVQGDGTGRRADLGAHGNLVNQILADYQSFPLGGGGYLRIMKISPSLNRVSVTTYSPYLDSYKTDPNNQFTVPYRTTGVNSTGTITGIVKSAVDCTRMAGFSVTAAGQTVKTDANGAFTIAAAATQNFNLDVAHSGWLSESKSATATSGMRSPAKIFVATGGRVVGVVQNTAGVPLAGAGVVFNGGSIRTTKSVKTDVNGKYYSDWIPVGSYSVTTSANGFAASNLSVTVGTGITRTLNITLH
jgi:hypothetical protein